MAVQLELLGMERVGKRQRGEGRREGSRERSREEAGRGGKEAERKEGRRKGNREEARKEGRKQRRSREGSRQALPAGSGIPGSPVPPRAAPCLAGQAGAPTLQHSSG